MWIAPGCGQSRSTNRVRRIFRRVAGATSSDLASAPAVAKTIVVASSQIRCSPWARLCSQHRRPESRPGESLAHRTFSPRRNGPGMKPNANEAVQPPLRPTCQKLIPTACTPRWWLPYSKKKNTLLKGYFSYTCRDRFS
jgi:hypothetical protein